MFEFLNRFFEKKELTEEQKASIIELIDNDESFINPRDVVVKRKHSGRVDEQAWVSYITPYLRFDDDFTYQVEQEIEALFNRICDVVDVELKKRHQNIRYVKSDYYYYRESAIDEIYRLARNVVVSFYRQENRETASFISYTMVSMLSNDICFLVTKEIDECRERLPFPDEETREEYKLTPFATKIIWWDPSGELRDKQVFGNTQMDYFDRVNKRVNKFTEVPALMTLCLEKYAGLLHIVLADLEDETIKWKVKPNNYFRQFFRLPLYDVRIWKETNSLPTDLYLLAENSIRKEIEGFRLAADEQNWQSLQQYLPKQTVQKIQMYLNQKTDLDFDYSTIASLRTVYKTAWNETVKFIMEQPAEKLTVWIEEIADDPDLKKIATKVIKNSNDSGKQMLFIFLMEKRAMPLSKAQQKQRDDFIHPTRQEEYQELLVKEELKYAIVPVLLKKLTQPARRKIKLDNGLITASNSALYNIIDMVDDYLAEEVDDQDTVSEISVPIEEPIEPKQAVSVSILEEVDKPELEQMEFLNYLVQSNGISLQEFKQQAAKKGKLYQAYLNELNEILYEEFEDQVLMIDEQQVIIEEDFMEEMREWING